MNPTYLEEDIQLIQKYFPGARRTTVRTPFDLTDHPMHPKQALTDTAQDISRSRYGWLGGTL
jgi:hypothetical protein